MMMMMMMMMMMVMIMVMMITMRDDDDDGNNHNNNVAQHSSPLRPHLVQRQVLAPHAVAGEVARVVPGQQLVVLAAPGLWGGAQADGRLDVGALAPPAGGCSRREGRLRDRDRETMIRETMIRETHTQR
jgi:hypothetical protein